MSLSAAPAGPLVWPYIAASTATFAVGRSLPSAFATGAYMSSSRAALGERAVARDGSEHPGFDLPEVRAHQDPADRRAHGRTQLRGEVVQARRRRHPAGALARAPHSAEPVVVADVALEPRPAVGRRDALGLAPGEQRGDGGGGPGVGLEAPGAGVGHVDARRARAGRARSPGCAGRPARPGTATAHRVTRPARGHLLRVAARSRADGRDEQILEHVARSIGQPVVLELDGEQRGHRLGQRGEVGQRRGAGRGAAIRQPSYAVLLDRLDREGERRPVHRVVEAAVHEPRSHSRLS